MQFKKATFEVIESVHVLIELENERARSRNVVGKNLSLRHTRELLDDGTETVTVSNNSHTLACEDLRADCVVPVGHHAVNRCLKRLSPGEDAWRKVLIATLEARVPLIAEIKLRRRDIIAATPLGHELFTVLGSRLSLIKTLEGTIVALVESPGLVVGDPKRAHLLADLVVGLNSAGEQ